MTQPVPKTLLDVFASHPADSTAMIFIASAIPRTATGKIQRRIVAETFAGAAS